MNKSLGAMILLLVVVSCHDVERKYTEKSVGQIKDANVIATSFNEKIKTQIKTDSMFIVVVGTPDLNIGGQLICRFDNKGEIVEVKDATGEWYDVHK